MNIIEIIKSLRKKSKAQQVETTIIFEKQCPHCSSRGMFNFNNRSNTQVNLSKSKLDPNVSLSLSKTDHNLK